MKKVPLWIWKRRLSALLSAFVECRDKSESDLAKQINRSVRDCLRSEGSDRSDRNFSGSENKDPKTTIEKAKLILQGGSYDPQKMRSIEIEQLWSDLID